MEELLEVISVGLIKFRSTDAFASMTVTSDFLSFCIDHDESYEWAAERMFRVQQLLEEEGSGE